MKALIVYESVYGNTEKIALAIAGAISETVQAKALRANIVAPADRIGIDLLILGTPTQGGRPLPGVKEFLDNLSPHALQGVAVTAFDTRMTMWVARAFGYPASHLAEELVKKGGHLVLPAEGFIVTDREGPLKPGEIERATEWSKSVIESFNNRK